MIERTIKKPSLTFKQQISLIFINLCKENLFNGVRSHWNDDTDEFDCSLTEDVMLTIKEIKTLTEELINKLDDQA